MLYCISCEQEVIEPIHPYMAYYDPVYGDEWDWCDGDNGELICSCPPPPIQDNWDEFVQEPSQDEMMLIEENTYGL